jgi:hypothetical protein
MNQLFLIESFSSGYCTRCTYEEVSAKTYEEAIYKFREDFPDNEILQIFVRVSYINSVNKG